MCSGEIIWRMDLCANREYLSIFAFVVVLYDGEVIVQKSRDITYTRSVNILVTFRVIISRSDIPF